MSKYYKQYIDIIDDKICAFIIKNKYTVINPTRHNIMLIIKYIVINLPEHFNGGEYVIKLEYISRFDDYMLAKYIYSIKNIEDIENYFVQRKIMVEKRLVTPRNPIVKNYFGTMKENVEKLDKILYELTELQKNLLHDKTKIMKTIKELGLKEYIQ